MSKGAEMKKKLAGVLLGAILLLTAVVPVFAQGIYKWVDDKGTVHFSDNPGSPIFKKEDKKPSEENAAAIAGRLAVGNRRAPRDEAKEYSGGIRLTFTSGQGGGTPPAGSRSQSSPVRRS
jgi:hypothetical protein